MNQSQFVAYVSEQLGISKAKALLLLKTLMDVAIEEVATKGKFVLPGIGTVVRTEALPPQGDVDAGYTQGRKKPSNRFKFKPGFHGALPEPRGKGSTATEREASHYKMLKGAYDFLCKRYGANKVRTELDAGYGGKIDLVVEHKRGSYDFYEIKVADSLRDCIREALGQLLEYAYYPKHSRAKRLIVVAEHELDGESKDYLNHLKSELKIPLFYSRYNRTTGQLEEEY